MWNYILQNLIYFKLTQRDSVKTNKRLAPWIFLFIKVVLPSHCIGYCMHAFCRSCTLLQMPKTGGGGGGEAYICMHAAPPSHSSLSLWQLVWIVTDRLTQEWRLELEGRCQHEKDSWSSRGLSDLALAGPLLQPEGPFQSGSMVHHSGSESLLFLQVRQAAEEEHDVEQCGLGGLTSSMERS